MDVTLNSTVAEQDIRTASRARSLHIRLDALIEAPDLGRQLRESRDLTRELTDEARKLSSLAWSTPSADVVRTEAARLETMRALYKLYRMRFFWFDDPARYVNEDEPLLSQLERALEAPWQTWLRSQVQENVRSDEPAGVLRAWAERDLTPSVEPSWFAVHADRTAYRRLLEIVSLNALVEASQLTRVMGGAPHPVQSTLFRILMEEYGAGRPNKKHSTFFAQMLEAEGMDTTPEAYFARVPWQVLSAINHSFYLTEHRRLYLRFCGAFTYTELSTPVGFAGYAAAAKRLGLSDGHADYWALHVREDERHGAWMIDEVALRLVREFPRHADDVLFGYAQQRVVEAMAGHAVEEACKQAQEGTSAS